MTSLLKRSLLTLLGSTLLISSAVHAVEPLQPYNAVYLSQFDGFSAEGVRELAQLPDGNWSLQHKAGVLFFQMEEQAMLSIIDHQIHPLAYRYDQSGRSKKDMQLAFDWKQLQVINQDKKSPWQMPIRDGQLDKLGYQLQIRLDLLKHGEQFGERSYQVVDRQRIKEYQVSFMGLETLTFGEQSITAAHLSQSREGKDRITHFWLVPDWNYLLVKMRQQDGDEEYEMTLQSAELNGQSITLNQR